MTATDVDCLRGDIARWRGLLPEAAPTYSQGIASSAAKQYEALLKGLVKRCVSDTGLDLESLSAEIRYTGAVREVDKLPLGTVTQLALHLTKQDDELAEALPQEAHETVNRIVKLRNDATHEQPPETMRAATKGLLDAIADVLARDRFARVLE